VLERYFVETARFKIKMTDAAPIDTLKSHAWGIKKNLNEKSEHIQLLEDSPD
jgi:hypothetical protein